MRFEDVSAIFVNDVKDDLVHVISPERGYAEGRRGIRWRRVSYGQRRHLQSQ